MTSVSPSAGSQYGGTLITVFGMGVGAAGTTVKVSISRLCFFIVCFTSYFVFSIAALPHGPGVVSLLCKYVPKYHSFSDEDRIQMVFNFRPLWNKINENEAHDLCQKHLPECTWHDFPHFCDMNELLTLVNSNNGPQYSPRLLY